MIGVDSPPSVITTADGSRTALNARYGQAYSSVHGARTQAETVFVRGTGTDRHPEPRVLEIGFGLGHNFRATQGLRDAGAPLTYLAYEFDPAPRDVLAALVNPDAPPWPDVLAAWGGDVHVRHGALTLDVLVRDVTCEALPEAWATAVYLDGFSPRVNPEVWTPELCERLAGALVPGGVLATYSAAGHVRRALAAAGLRIEKRSGLRGKREFVVATRP
jgi:tRNA U34 5-methylaminomethyl-2-thiouridine-forming methyltransferase MnmC